MWQWGGVGPDGEWEGPWGTMWLYGTTAQAAAAGSAAACPHHLPPPHLPLGLGIVWAGIYTPSSTSPPGLQVRLLLAGLFVPRADRPRLVPLLAELSSGAAGSQDEWVRATAAAVGDWAGPLDTAALAAQFPLVGKGGEGGWGCR